MDVVSPVNIFADLMSRRGYNGVASQVITRVPGRPLSDFAPDPTHIMCSPWWKVVSNLEWRHLSWTLASGSLFRKTDHKLLHGTDSSRIAPMGARVLV